MASFPTLLILLLTTVLVVLGCGVMPQGQARTTSFTVTGFTLPGAMVYSTTPAIPDAIPGSATSREAVISFVSRLVMKTVTDVLEQQGRSAGLPDAITSMILNQLTVQISYDPLECKGVALKSVPDLQIPVMPANMNHPYCVVIGNTVTALCTATGGGRNMCDLSMSKDIQIIAGKHLSISGTLTTTNIIMANWSKAMWQSVVNRAVRMLASSRLDRNSQRHLRL
ncbi:hypothetical protein KIN20_028007 [Parelaphostrongylus tenuis]|uniref:Secreted protein n=1 Tax=Parelaphostrongylus tenuis TaxID=148309 RepID=A0AAD5R0G4_PARTN|nr:hypothetical protein KIN20_028007 [Parelaphostrongylus tenuis]